MFTLHPDDDVVELLLDRADLSDAMMEVLRVRADARTPEEAMKADARILRLGSRMPMEDIIRCSDESIARGIPDRPPVPR